jgi:hypothetical protein
LRGCLRFAEQGTADAKKMTERPVCPDFLSDFRPRFTRISLNFTQRQWDSLPLLRPE